jgi:hypothetical protein
MAHWLCRNEPDTLSMWRLPFAFLVAMCALGGDARAQPPPWDGSAGRTHWVYECVLADDGSYRWTYKSSVLSRDVIPSPITGGPEPEFICLGWHSLSRYCDRVVDGSGEKQPCDAGFEFRHHRLPELNQAYTP